MTYRRQAVGDPGGTVAFKEVYKAGARVPQRPLRWAATLAALALPLSVPVWAQGTATTGVGSQFELTFWQSVESGNDPALYEAYLAQYPNGTFSTVARVKLARLRQMAAPAPAPIAAPIAASIAAPAPAPAAPASLPAQQPLAAPAPAVQEVRTAPAATPPVVTASAPQAAITAPPPAAAPARAQLASAATRTQPRASRERLVAPPPASPRPSPVPTPAAHDESETAPFVTAAPPTEPAPESSESDALRRLLGALGDSQRLGAAAPSPIVDTADGAATDTAPLTAPAAPMATPAAAPAAAPPRLVEVSGPPVAVPDAAALSARAVPAAESRPIAVGPLPPGFALPPRPQLAAIPPVAFPASFCSAEARNAFHDGTYVTAVEASKRNNDAAIAYMHQLQDLYDTNQLSGDINPMNAVASEARAYGPVAAAAFAAQSALVSAFNTLMAVPIIPCEAPKQP
ncbi:hypothetical protein [Novosphingobium sp.]|uniref:hypothetical protein n=1 Tax=Novosphingobium sp. TaxID=1874826 RepID=UPI003BAC6E63